MDNQANSTQLQTKVDPSKRPMHEGIWKEGFSYLDDINYHRMANFLEIDLYDRRDYHIAEKISLLTDWAKEQSKSDDQLKHYLEIKNLAKQLGYQIKGKELITKLYHWIRLDIDRKRIDQQMGLYRTLPQKKVNANNILSKNKKTESIINSKKIQEVAKQIESTVKAQIVGNINRGIEKTLDSIVTSYGGKNK